MKPRYPLQRLRAAIEEDRFRLGAKRCQEHLLAHLPSLLACRAFAADVIRNLQEEDFSRSVCIGEMSFDEFGLRLPSSVLEAHGLEGKTTWYLKVQLQGASDDELVFFLSLHALERPLRRRGGVLSPEW